MQQREFERQSAAMLHIASIVAEAEEPAPANKVSSGLAAGLRKSGNPQKSLELPDSVDDADFFRLCHGIFKLDPTSKAEFPYKFVDLQKAIYGTKKKAVNKPQGEGKRPTRSSTRSSDATLDSSSSVGGLDDEDFSRSATPQLTVSRPTTPARTPTGEKHKRSKSSDESLKLKKRPKTPDDHGYRSPSPNLSFWDEAGMRDYIPGGPKGVHISPGTPSTLEHRRRLFEKILAKKRAGQSIGGVRPGNPLDVSETASAEWLTDAEFEVCAGLRLTPMQFFHSRWVLLEAFWREGWFNKSAAQKMLRIDVNKTGRLWEFCVAQKWMQSAPGQPLSSVRPPPHDSTHYLKFIEESSKTQTKK